MNGGRPLRRCFEQLILLLMTFFGTWLFSTSNIVYSEPTTLLPLLEAPTILRVVSDILIFILHNRRQAFISFNILL